MAEFNIGDRVRIRGDYTDFTDHMDGELGTVIGVMKDDCKVVVDNYSNICGYWLIWKENMTHV